MSEPQTTEEADVLVFRDLDKGEIGSKEQPFSVEYAFGAECNADSFLGGAYDLSVRTNARVFVDWYQKIVTIDPKGRIEQSQEEKAVDPDGTGLDIIQNEFIKDLLARIKKLEEKTKT